MTEHESDEHLAGFILKRFEDWGKNRRDKQLKWEKNREAFLASFENHWKLKNLKDWETPPFIRATKQKVMAGYALVIDVLMQGGRIPYHFKLSPWADRKLEDLPPEIADIERESLDDAKSLSDEQLQMTRSDRAFMRNILSMALYGETVAKFLVKTITRKRRKPMAVDGLGDLGMVSRNRLQFETVEEGRDVPGWGYLSVWDFFYDMEGGIHDGAGCIHRRLVNNHWLRKRAKRPGYIADNIKELLEESDAENYEFKIDETTLAPSMRNLNVRENKRQYLEFWGRVPKKRIEAFMGDLDKNRGAEYSKTLIDLTDSDERGEDIECCVHVCDGKVVFFAYTRQDDRPFELSYWEDPLDELAGEGVADNVSDMQGLLNDIFRDYVKNKKQAGSVKGMIKRRMIDGDVKDDDFEKPGVLLEMSEDCNSAQEAYQQILVQDVGQSFQPLLQLVLTFLDEDSMIARIMQGGEPQGDVTAKQIMEQTEKGGKYIATVVQNTDERLIEPMMNRFFDYNMADPENDRGQGDFVAEALGFSSFMDKQVRVTRLSQLLDLMLANEALQKKYGIEGLFEEIAKALDISIDQFERSEEELAAMNAPDPLMQVQIAKEESEIARNESAADLDRAKAAELADREVRERAKLAEDIRRQRTQPAAAEA